MIMIFCTEPVYHITLWVKFFCQKKNTTPHKAKKLFVVQAKWNYECGVPDFYAQRYQISIKTSVTIISKFSRTNKKVNIILALISSSTFFIIFWAATRELWKFFSLYSSCGNGKQFFNSGKSFVWQKSEFTEHRIRKCKLLNNSKNYLGNCFEISLVNLRRI